jgi:hypothetical protein
LIHESIALPEDQQMKFFPASLLTAVLSLSVIPASAVAWTTGLQGGGVVTVDPDTQRATLTRDGVTTPLWNGVHRLQDGSAMIVTHGEVVTGTPAATPYQLPAPEETDWEGALIAGYSPCEKLTHHVCGLHNECATSKACGPSQQLLAMEQEERSNAADHSRMTFTSGQCIKARKDVEFFTACRPGE